MKSILKLCLIFFMLIAVVENSYALSAQQFVKSQNDAIKYIQTVEKLEEYITVLEEEVEKEKANYEKWGNKRLELLGIEHELLKEWQDYKANERYAADDCDLHIAFHQAWIGYLEQFANTGVNRHEGEGKALYEWMGSPEYAFAYHWSRGGSPPKYETLYYIYASRFHWIRTQTLLEFATLLKVGGISSTEYDELLAGINSRPTYTNETWGAITESRYERPLFNLLKDIGTEYKKLLKDGVKEDYMTKLIENTYYRGRLLGEITYKDELGRITHLEGEVYIKKFNTDQFYKMESIAALRPGDVIKTGDNGRMTIHTGKGILSIASKTIFTVGGLEIEHTETSTMLEFKRIFLGYLGEGKVQYESETSTVGNAVESIIDLFVSNGSEDNYNATLGIRSSVVVSKVDGKMDVSLLEGNVDISLVGTALSESIVTGQQFSISDNNTSGSITSFDEKTVLKDFDGSVTSSSKEIIFYLGNPHMYVDGVSQRIDQEADVKPLVIDGHTLIPIRALIEAIDGTVGWDHDTKKITISLDDQMLFLWLNVNYGELNGQRKEISVAPRSIHGRTLVPLRFVTENLGFTVDWYAPEKKITITK